MRYCKLIWIRNPWLPRLPFIKRKIGNHVVSWVSPDLALVYGRTSTHVGEEVAQGADLAVADDALAQRLQQTLRPRQFLVDLVPQRHQLAGLLLRR